ncbi:MAG: FHA domain-containing protein [Campylobacterales bacterium]|nr:FHA domain-containing protein [Campylobacterales bacterium]
MERYKICPTCKSKNDISNFLCDNCLADISNVEEYKPKAKTLKLVNNDYKLSIMLKEGDILGRDYVGKEELKAFKTISRKHARFFLHNGEWAVEDLDSSNGSYVQGKKFKKIRLKNGLKLSLSKSFEFEVVIED